MPEKVSNRVRVGTSDDVPDGGRLVVSVGDLEIGVFRLGDVLYAYENMCPHAGGPVCQGKILPRVHQELDEAKRTTVQRWDTDNIRIICPWHGYEFDLKTGKLPVKPHVRLTSFSVEEVNGEVFVELN